MPRPNRSSGRAAASKGKGKPKKEKAVGDLLGQIQSSFDGMSKGEVDKIMNSRFEREFKRLRKQFGSKGRDFQEDQATRAMYRSMMAMLLDLLPMAEKQYRERRSEGALYALSAILNQLKDCSSQIRNLASHEQQADYIASSILGSTMVLAVQTLMTSMAQVKAHVDQSSIKTAEAKAIRQKMDIALRDYAGWLQQATESMSVKVRDYLCGGAQAGQASYKPRRAGPRSREASGEAAAAA